MTEPTPDAEQQHDGPQPVTKADGTFYVPLKLAHPLSADRAAYVQALVVKDYNVGNTIKVTRDWGNAMIEQGRVQVDPTDRVAVRKALYLNDRDLPLTDEEIAQLLGGPADAAGPAPVEAQQSPADDKAKAPAKKS